MVLSDRARVFISFSGLLAANVIESGQEETNILTKDCRVYTCSHPQVAKYLISDPERLLCNLNGGRSITN